MEQPIAMADPVRIRTEAANKVRFHAAVGKPNLLELNNFVSLPTEAKGRQTV